MLDDFPNLWMSLMTINNNYVLSNFFRSLLSYNLMYLILFLITIIQLINVKKYAILWYIITATLVTIFFISSILKKSYGFHFYTEPHFKALVY